jgi:hypothetical protein
MDKMDEIWFFEHSVACPVPRSFAWQFWTDVNNWRLDGDVESIELNGPFAPGSRGATITRSSGRVEWRIAEVQSESEALIEFPAPGAIGRFRWTFEDLERGTRMTQRASILTPAGMGEAALPLVNAIAGALEEGIPAGMRKLGAAMAEAAASGPLRQNPATSS